MKPIDQTRFGEDGNCLAACLASLLEVPLDAVPEFGHDPANACLNEWLRPLGFYAVTLHGPQEAGGEPWFPAGYHIAGGQSAGGPHAVVAFGDGVVHDPNPNRAGLITHEDFTILVPFNPLRCR